MNIEILTIAMIESLLLITQIIVLYVQYRVNKTYRGIRWWVFGSTLMALGVIFMPMIFVNSIAIFAIFANPLVVLGQIFLYIGVVHFLDKKENKRLLICIFFVFLMFYYYYMVINSSISARIVVVNSALAIITFMTAFLIFAKKDRFISFSANFTGVVFLIYGCLLTIRAGITLILPSIYEYKEQENLFIIAFIITTIISTLWTFGFIIMFNQRLNIENLLEKDKMQKVFNTSPDAAIITRLNDGLIIDVNKGFSVMTGHTHEEVIGKSTLEINLWDNSKEREKFLFELVKNGMCENMEFVFRRKDESQFNVIISARIITIYDIPHISTSIHNITEQKKAAKELIESEEIHRSILFASPDDITITDLEGRILMVSPAAKSMYGYEQDFEGFIGMQLIDFIVPEEVERAKSNLLQMYKGEQSRPNEYHGVRKDKSIFDIEVNSGFISNSNGQPTKMLFVIRDITERKLTEQKIQQLVLQLELERNTAQLNSITDSLTGLLNRRYFDETLDVEFHRLKRYGDVLSLIMLDVDYFKNFNDTYGHIAGDDCLRQIGALLKTIVGRAPDFVARYGGEEFVVILPKTQKDGAKIIAERILKEVGALAIPHITSDIENYVTVSIGVVTVNTSEFDSSEQVVILADEAMYSAKKGGRNRIEISM